LKANSRQKAQRGVQQISAAHLKEMRRQVPRKGRRLHRGQRDAVQTQYCRAGLEGRFCLDLHFDPDWHFDLDSHFGPGWRFCQGLSRTLQASDRLNRPKVLESRELLVRESPRTDFL
jgi:hypothetical protein